MIPVSIPTTPIPVTDFAIDDVTITRHDGETWILGDLIGRKVHMLDGNGHDGQRRWIIANDATTLTIHEAFDAFEVVPDAFHVEPVGGYLRHRGRMIAQSVFDDATETLRGNGWLEPPLLGMLNGKPLKFIDYFPEDAESKQVKLEFDVLAMDQGRSGEEREHELGGIMEIPYEFMFAIAATGDAIPQALFEDLKDRYNGRTASPFVSLYNFALTPPIEVVRMEVEEFQYSRSSDDVAPGTHLWFARLALTDYVERTR